MSTKIGPLREGAFDGRGQCVYQRLDFRQQCGIVEGNLNIVRGLADGQDPDPMAADPDLAIRDKAVGQVDAAGRTAEGVDSQPHNANLTRV